MTQEDLDLAMGMLRRSPSLGNQIYRPDQYADDFTLQREDMGSVICCDKDTLLSVTIQNDTNLSGIPDGIEVHIFNHGDGALALIPESGVTIMNPYGPEPAKFYRVKRRSANTWHVIDSKAVTVSTEIMLGPVNFQSSRDASFFKYSYRTSNAGELECMDSEDEAVASFVIPRGYKATKILVFGSSTANWKVKRSDPAADNFDSETTGGVVGTEKTIGEIPHLAGTVCILRINMTVGDLLRGAKITLAPITS